MVYIVHSTSVHNSTKLVQIVLSGVCFHTFSALRAENWSIPQPEALSETYCVLCIMYTMGSYSDLP